MITAPSISPKLEIGKITPSFVELSWDEIPLQQRNGIIAGYRIFYRDEKNNTRGRLYKIAMQLLLLNKKRNFPLILFCPSYVVIVTEDRQVVLKDLYPFTIYEIFLMSSTHGGSVNGSTVTVKTAYIGIEYRIFYRGFIFILIYNKIIIRLFIKSCFAFALFLDAFEIVLFIIPACVGLILFFFGVFTCFNKQKW